MRGVGPNFHGGRQLAFADISDVELRIGRDLTMDEQGAVASLLQGAQSSIEVEIGRTEAEIGTVPAVIKAVCVALVCRSMANPFGLASESENLGAYSKSQTYNRNAAGDMTLSGAERLLVRKAVYGTNTGSAKLEATLLKEALDEAWGS